MGEGAPDTRVGASVSQGSRCHFINSFNYENILPPLSPGLPLWLCRLPPGIS